MVKRFVPCIYHPQATHPILPDVELECDIDAMDLLKEYIRG